MALMVMHFHARRLTFAALAAAALFSVAACKERSSTDVVAQAAEPPADTAPGAAAKQAALPDLGAAPAWMLKNLDGQPVRSTDFKGKVMVVDFWATWCPPCREEIPGYVELQKKYAEKGLVIVGLSLDQQGPGVVKSFAQRFGINYPLVMGDEATVEAFGGVEAIPTTFVIDREGRIRHKKVGMMAHDEYEKVIAQLFE